MPSEQQIRVQPRKIVVRDPCSGQVVLEEAHQLPVSFELGQVVQTLLCSVEGVVDVRVLDRRHPKIFVITEAKRDLARDREIVRLLVQIEDVRPNDTLNYDIVPVDRADLIPSSAKSVRKS